MNNPRSPSRDGKSGTRVVVCPHCGRAVHWTPENAFRPFCSERCKLIDLGQWATEQYRIPLESEPNGADDPETRDPGGGEAKNAR